MTPTTTTIRCVLITNMQDNRLTPTKRFITGHNSDDKAIFSKAIPEPLKWQELPDSARFSLGYTTDQFHVNFSDEADIFTYQHYLEKLPVITGPGGTGPTTRRYEARSFVSHAPDDKFRLWRCAGREGGTRTGFRGDRADEARGCRHTERNESCMAECQLDKCSQDALCAPGGCTVPFEIEGRKLGEGYGRIPCVRPSK